MSPITIEGHLSGSEWSGAGVLPITEGSVNYGSVMMKNDAQYLYIALDVTRDMNNDPGTEDYFWFMVDTDRNRGITPHRDINFGVYPNSPNSIGKQYFLGPATWTGLHSVPGAQLRIGFGPTPNSSVAHRFWEIRIPLSELEVDLSEPLPSVYFGLRLASTTPRFVVNSPNNAFTDFSQLHQVFLARTAAPAWTPASAGPVIGGVGLIPATQISIDGFATTSPSYFVNVRDAAFTGTLNLIGNHETMIGLWNDGARKYRILHRDPAASGFSPIRQAWANYRWNGSAYVLEHFGPDAGDMYRLNNPSGAFSIMDLLLQWNTVGFQAGAHRFQAAFFREDNTPISLPVEQTMTLAVDNNQPTVSIDSIRHGSAEVGACEIITLASASDTVNVTYTARDPEGHLGAYRVNAFYGNGSSVAIASDNYAAHSSPPHSWAGVSEKSDSFTPPVTCAYEFRVTAHHNVTNGYHGPSEVRASRYVTIIKPNAPKYTLKDINLLGIPLPRPR